MSAAGARFRRRAELLAAHHADLAAEAEEYAAAALDDGSPTESSMWAEEGRLRRADADAWRVVAES